MSVEQDNRPFGIPGMHRCDVHEATMPGIIILVHGVNSDGEWYEETEKGLIEGLNKRLGFDRAKQPDRCQLVKAEYAEEVLPGGKINRQLDGDNFITDPGRSPVIRFRWGYKIAGQDSTDPNAADEDKEYKQSGRLWLNEMDAWGGGPFQNGTTALPYMWGIGMDDRVFWWWYTNMFPVDGREIYACPPRAYYAHASHRLKELIKAIRSKQPDCPITVVCHSQGNMITLGAAMLGLKDNDAIADTYVMCNPPYNLASPGMEKITGAKLPGGAGEFGHVTDKARQETFKRFLAGVAKRAGKGQSAAEINNRLAFKDGDTGETVFELSTFPEGEAARQAPTGGKDRDNRGKVFLYCNPHDQVIGITPVQGIGWKGLHQEDIKAVDGEGKIYQRVWAQSGGEQSPPFAVGSPAWTRYRYIADNYNPQKFWNPKPPMMRYVLSLNPSQGFLSRIVTIATSVFIWPVTHLFNIPINDDPDKSWEVPINAPVLPEPVVPKAKRYGQVSTGFDEGKDPVIDALDPANRDKWADILPEKAQPIGSKASEAQWEYEANARIESAKRRGEIGDSEEDRRAAMSRYLKENPNATDHGTILTNPEHAAKALAYDVAVGCVNPDMITDEDMHQFREFAHWMYMAESKLDTEGFKQYWNKGLFKMHQVQYTYTHAHMQANTDIVDERKQNFLGVLR